MSDHAPAAPPDTSLSAAIRDRDGNTSSTRVAGFFALFVVMAMIALGQFTSHPADPVNVVALLAFAFGCFGLKIPEWLGAKRAV